MLHRFGLTTERRVGNTTSRAEKGLLPVPRATPTRSRRLPRSGAARCSADYLRVDDELGAARREASRRSRASRGRRRRRGARPHELRDVARLACTSVPEARFVAEQANVSLYNAELSDLSMLFVAQQTAVTAGMLDSQSETMRVAGGNSIAPERDGRRARQRGRARRAGHGGAARDRPDGVGVTARGREHFGAHVVLAVPPPPLRRRALRPAPARRRLAAAIAGLDLGGATKVVNQYHAPFWLEQRRVGVQHDRSDLSHLVGRGRLVRRAAPACSRRSRPRTTRVSLAALGDDHADRDACAIDSPSCFRRALAGAPGPAATVAWNDEPFTGGGYAAYKPGQLGSVLGAVPGRRRPHPLRRRAHRVAGGLHGERGAERSAGSRPASGCRLLALRERVLADSGSSLSRSARGEAVGG